MNIQEFNTEIQKHYLENNSEDSMYNHFKNNLGTYPIPLLFSLSMICQPATTIEDLIDEDGKLKLPIPSNLRSLAVGFTLDGLSNKVYKDGTSELLDIYNTESNNRFYYVLPDIKWRDRASIWQPMAISNTGYFAYYDSVNGKYRGLYNYMTEAKDGLPSESSLKLIDYFKSFNGKVIKWMKKDENGEPVSESVWKKGTCNGGKMNYIDDSGVVLNYTEELLPEKNFTLEYGKYYRINVEYFLTVRKGFISNVFVPNNVNVLTWVHGYMFTFEEVSEDYDSIYEIIGEIK